MGCPTGIIYALIAVSALMAAAMSLLLFRGAIHHDSAGTLRVRLPLLGEVQTTGLAQAFLAISAIALASAVYITVKSLAVTALQAPTMSIDGTITSNAHPVVIYVAVNKDAREVDGKFLISVPCPKNPDFNLTILYSLGGKILGDPSVKILRECSDVHLGSKQLTVPEEPTYQAASERQNGAVVP
jgi:hypothetical protein